MEGRAFFEYAALRAGVHALPFLPHGDGHPVVVVPGYGAADRITAPLRRTLDRLGWDTHAWGQGRNRGPSVSAIEGVADQVARLRSETGQEVSLVGWSLGGTIAREAVRRSADGVRCVITLGSPFRFRSGDSSSILALMERLGPVLPRLPLAQDLVESPPEHEREPLGVPVSAIYSPTDGIVRPQLCLEATGPLRESIAVRSSHTGLTWNPAVLYAISDRLAQPSGAWTPFRVPRGARALFPDPAVWIPHQR